MRTLLEQQVIQNEILTDQINGQQHIPVSGITGGGQDVQERIALQWEARLEREKHTTAQVEEKLTQQRDAVFKLKTQLKQSEQKSKKYMDLFYEHKRQHKIIELKSKENEALKERNADLEQQAS